MKHIYMHIYVCIRMFVLFCFVWAVGRVTGVVCIRRLWPRGQKEGTLAAAVKRLVGVCSIVSEVLADGEGTRLCDEPSRFG